MIFQLTPFCVSCWLALAVVDLLLLCVASNRVRGAGRGIGRVADRGRAGQGRRHIRGADSGLLLKC